MNPKHSYVMAYEISFDNTVMSKESTQGIVIMVNADESSAVSEEYAELKEHLAIMAMQEIMQQKHQTHVKKMNFACACSCFLIVIIIAVSAIALFSYYSVEEAKRVQACMLGVNNCTKK